MTVVLQAQGIVKKFRQPDGSALTILDHIDLTLTAGEVTCLLGASGCGKTTLLGILAGTDLHFEGRLETTVERPSPKLGYLSQSDKLLPWRSAAENVGLGLELMGRSAKTTKNAACEALALVGLAAFADHYPKQLSGGMQQRVLLARMLALQPQLLLLDEPMSSLDVPARRELAAIIKTYVRTHNAAALIVTHSVEEACFLADRVLLITRAPAHIGKEIRLADTATVGALERGNAMDIVMQELQNTLKVAA